MKPQIVAAVLLWIALWPLAHRALVARFDANPWKFAGWAMYTVPTLPVPLALFAGGDAGGVYLDERKLPPKLQETMERFRHERSALGTLRRPDDLARVAFEARSDLDELFVVVQKLSVDRQTARITASRQTYSYRRPEPGG